MRIGIFAKTFPGHDPAVVLRAVRAAGYRCTHLNLASAGLETMPDSVPAATLEAIAAVSRESGVVVSNRYPAPTSGNRWDRKPRIDPIPPALETILETGQ